MLKYLDLGYSSIEVSKAVFGEYGIDLDAEVQRLNDVAPELAAGDILLQGAKAAAETALRGQLVITPQGTVRAYNADSIIEQEEGPILQAIQSGVRQVYKENGEVRRASGTFTALLERTVSDVQQLAKKYREYSESYAKRAAALEWIVEEAMKRGLSANDRLQKAFTEADFAKLEPVAA